MKKMANGGTEGVVTRFQRVLPEAQGAIIIRRSQEVGIIII